jgi:hypothetical protein
MIPFTIIDNRNFLEVKPFVLARNQQACSDGETTTITAAILKAAS